MNEKNHEEGGTQPRLGTVLFLLTVLVGIVGALYFEILWDMVADWYNYSDYSHGFLVPLLSGYFVWERRRSLQSIFIQPSLWGCKNCSTKILVFVCLPCARVEEFLLFSITFHILVHTSPRQN